MTAAQPLTPFHNNIKAKQLVLFDFDGTITTKDTLGEFMKFYHGTPKYYFGLAMLSPILGAYVFKLMPNWKSKEMFLKWFLKDEPANKFKERCHHFALIKIPQLIRPQAKQAIEKYKKSGAEVVVVTASAECWVKPWCDMMGIHCIATHLEIENEKITGKISGKNCHGPEKVCRIQERYNLNDFDKVIAYGDTSGDNEMLALADERHFQPFREKF